VGTALGLIALLFAFHSWRRASANSSGTRPRSRLPQSVREIPAVRQGISMPAFIEAVVHRDLSREYTSRPAYPVRDDLPPDMMGTRDRV
jgi:hypothetical protein